jgi:hypothetical protein
MQKTDRLQDRPQPSGSAERLLAIVCCGIGEVYCPAGRDFWIQRSQQPSL